MRRERQRTRLTKCRHLKESCDTRAASGIGLQDIDCSGRQHALEVRQIVAIFSSGYLHSAGRAVAQQAQPVEIVGGNWLLEPRHAEVVKSVGKLQRLFSRIRAVGVDEQFDVCS